MIDKEQPNGKMEEIPNGYLSNEEIANQYPMYAQNVEAAVDADHKPTMKIMVYINEEAPIKARLMSKDEIVELPNKTPIPMFAYDVLMMTGNPPLRFDLPSQPDNVDMLNESWEAVKRNFLENSLRNYMHAGRGEKVMRYADKKYLKQAEKLGWFGKIPDFRILMNADVVETVAPKVDLVDKVWDIMLRNNIPIREKYEDKEAILVANELQHEAMVYGMEAAIGGANSHAHMKYFMMDAANKANKQSKSSK
jgi:hypothetical protein